MEQELASETDLLEIFQQVRTTLTFLREQVVLEPIDLILESISPLITSKWVSEINSADNLELVASDLELLPLLELSVPTLASLREELPQ